MGTRRRFLTVAARGMACAACSPALTACGNDREAPPLEEDVVVTLADYPDLEAVDGLVALEPDLTGYDGYTIFVRNMGDDQFLALGSFCNHRECSVLISSDGFRCPCHGSAFAADGRLTTGPATADLVEFETESDGTTLTIFAG